MRIESIFNKDITYDEYVNDTWLSDTEDSLKSSGYTRYNQNLKHEDFSYIKTIDKKYQVCVLFYDFRNYDRNKISIQYDCLLICSERVDLIVSNYTTVSEFEKLSESFYEMIRTKNPELL